MLQIVDQEIHLATHGHHGLRHILHDIDDVLMVLLHKIAQFPFYNPKEGYLAVGYDRVDRRFLQKKTVFPEAFPGSEDPDQCLLWRLIACIHFGMTAQDLIHIQIDFALLKDQRAFGNFEDPAVDTIDDCFCALIYD